MSSAETLPFLVKYPKFWYNLGSPKPLIGNQVRHILTLLLLLLLSSFLTSCDKKEAILYRGEKTSSGFEWKTIRDNYNNPQYKGEVMREYIIFGDSFPEGHGSLIFPDESKYVGEWKDGRPNGQGTYTFGKGEKEGQKYVGEWKDGIRNGQGTFTWKDGTKYEGEWKDGRPNGQGTRTFTNGDKYVGEWKNSKENGNGKRNSPDGRNYVGEWKDGKEHGQGTFTFPDGRKYVGEFKDGILHGQGKFIFPDGRKYVGEFKDGKEWNGTGYNKNGEIVVRFVNGKMINQ